jgi:hypothetical protein
MIFIAVLFLSLISLKDLPSLIQKSRRKEIILYGIITLVNVVMATLVQLEIDFPTPHRLLSWFGRQWLG